MHNTAILVPVFALAGWTGLVLLLVAGKRLSAGVSPREFALGESAQVPERVQLANRNYMNLLELPLLFYVVCILGFAVPTSSTLLLPLAWAYVALRMAHSLVHILYNNVLHRFLVFATSNFVLLALWVVVGRAVFGGVA